MIRRTRSAVVMPWESSTAFTWENASFNIFILSSYFTIYRGNAARRWFPCKRLDFAAFAIAHGSEDEIGNGKDHIEVAQHVLVVHPVVHVDKAISAEPRKEPGRLRHVHGPVQGFVEQ